MSSRHRTATPVARAANAANLPRRSSSSSPGPAPSTEPGRCREAAPARQAHAAVAPRRPTDVCCALLFLALSGGLGLLAARARESGDLRRLTRGFDFRGRLCEGDEDATGNGTVGGLLHWCSFEGKVRWDAPVCVSACPAGGEPPLLCPLPAEEAPERAETLADGSVVLTKVTTQRLVPAALEPARQYWHFCVDQRLEAQLLGDGSTGLSAAGAAAADTAPWLLAAAGQAAALAEVPRLLAAVAVAAAAAGFAWVVLLSAFAGFILRAALLEVGWTLAGLGAVLLLPGSGPGAAALARWLAGVAERNPLAAAAEGWNPRGALASTFLAVLGPLLARMERFSAFLAAQSVAVPANVELGVGLALLVAGCGVLAWYFVLRRSIAAAADCTREACKIMLRAPTLALLPLIEAVAQAAVLAAASWCLLTFLSTAEVRPASIQLFGERVAGLHRSIDWTWDLALGALCYAFACLWYLELIAALRSFVLSYAAVSWYFGGGRGVSATPILRGTAVAISYHLGSLALGAAIMAALRGVHWVLQCLHGLAGERRASRCARCCLGALDVALAAARALVRRLSESAYTDIALNSSSYADASWDAAGLLAENARLVAIRAVMRPLAFVGSAAYAAAFGWCAWAILAAAPAAGGGGQDPLAALLPPGLAEERARLASPGLLALLGAVVAFLAARGCSAVVQELADAVLYCFLWDKQDGVLDAKGAPHSFRALVGVGM